MNMNAVETLTAAGDHVGRLLDPEVQAISADFEANTWREKLGVPDLSFLAPDAVDRVRASAIARMRQEAADMLASSEQIAQQEIRQREDAIARSRVLPSYSDTLAPSADTTSRHLALLLDETKQERAETYLTSRPIATILARYKDADELGADRAFVRELERRHASGETIGTHGPLTAPDVVQTIAALSRAVAERQQAREPTGARAEIDAIRQVQARYAKQRLLLSPTRGAVRASIKTTLAAAQPSTADAKGRAVRAR